MVLETVSNFLHILATTAWIGGMIYVNIILMPALSAIEPSQRGRLLGATTKGFTILSWSSVIVLVLTGFGKTPSQMLFNFTGAYGISLAVKHILTLIMIVIGAVITFRLGPKMQSLSPSPGGPPAPEFLKVQNQLAILGRVNMVLGVAVLLLAAIIT